MIPEFSSLPCSTRPQRFEFGVCSLEILVPTDPEEMLNEAVEHEDSDERTTDPYWGLLWDAAPRTATFLCRSPLTASHSVRGLTALELGCGIGLAGVAALHCGMQVTFSDLVPAAVALALENARRNGFRNASGLVLDWTRPQPHRFDILIGSDVLYDQQNHLPLLSVMEQMLDVGGQALIGDAGRHHMVGFLRLAEERGWVAELYSETGERLPGPRHLEFQMLRLTRGET